MSSPEFDHAPDFAGFCPGCGDYLEWAQGHVVTVATRRDHGAVAQWDALG